MLKENCAAIQSIPHKSVVAMASPSKFPVESRASPSVMQATGSGMFVAERTLRRDVPDAVEVEPAWLKVTKSQTSFVNRHTVVQRDQFTKTMASPEAPEFLTVPEVSLLARNGAVQTTCANRRGFMCCGCRCNLRPREHVFQWKALRDHQSESPFQRCARARLNVPVLPMLRRQRCILVRGLQGWGATSSASPTWMTISTREMPVERIPYLTSPYKTGSCLYVAL